MKLLNTILIDDSSAIRSELKLLLSEFTNILVVGEASNIEDSIKLVEDKKPDLIFLDIQLKNESGFDLLEKTNVSSKIIFVTAHNQYAVKAFEVNALDYLLKPIQPKRLKKAIAKLTDPDQDVSAQVEMSKLNYKDVVYLMINHSPKFFKVADLKIIIAEGKYSFLLHGKNKKDLVSKTLLEWESILPENYFIRIHRSTIVNFQFVESVKKCSNNTHEVFVEGFQDPFIMSRRHAAKLKAKINF